MNKKRVFFIYFLFLCAVTFLCARFYIIADRGSFVAHALAGQYSRRLDIAKRNGFIFDRNGNHIDVSQDGYITVVSPMDLSDNKINDLAKKLSEESSGSQSYFSEKLISGRPFVTVTYSDITDKYCKSFAKYDENHDNLCHLIGYRNSEGKGVSGIMQVYDDFLVKFSSAKVFARYLADAKGRTAQGTKIEIIDNGYEKKDGIYLTIDLQIQKAVERICAENLDMGAVVVQNTNTGEILAMVSMPQYKKESLAEYLGSDRGELLNRCLIGYTPGSVFKTVIAAAALSDGSFDPEAMFECTGYIEIDQQKIKCHNIYGHGQVNLTKAFESSCNPYFIDIGIKLGAQKIIDMAHKMGVGQYSAINLIGCTKGVLPSTSVSDGTVANMSVGQGEVLLSPVQVASIMSTSATGFYRKPSIIQKTVVDDDVTHYGLSQGERILEDGVVERMREMFVACVENGTGYRAKSESVMSAGKTATAQSGQIKDGKEVIHSWFAGYFPADDPKYTVCVLCDGNGVGNTHPSLIFKMLAETIGEFDKEGHE